MGWSIGQLGLTLYPKAIAIAIAITVPIPTIPIPIPILTGIGSLSLILSIGNIQSLDGT